MSKALTYQPQDLYECYRQQSGQVYMNGVQALARIPMAQVRKDRAAGLNTGGFISGYRGSPLGLLDKTLSLAKPYLDPLNIRFQTRCQRGVGRHHGVGLSATPPF
tara:strand:- start:665 stop:979 length:315 start_codon:yes stop_codon:yes gene_type:complete